jgi:hypothetical protein
VSESFGAAFTALFLDGGVSLLAGLFSGFMAGKRDATERQKWLAWVGLVPAVNGPPQPVFLGVLAFLVMGFGLMLVRVTTAFLVMGFGPVLIGIATI